MKKIVHLVIFASMLTVFSPVSATTTPWWRLTTFQTEVNALSKEKVEDLQVPILIGVAPGGFKDTWQVARQNGTVHEGVDIFAPRGAYVVSPTDAVVTRIDMAGAGGIAVYTANPGEETYYFAHLTAVGPTIVLGAKLAPGDLIGYVGNTGNAAGSSTHLHFTIYTLTGPVNPYPRLTKEFSTDDRIAAVEKIIDRSDNPALAAKSIVGHYKDFFLAAQKANEDLPKEITAALSGTLPLIASSTTVIPPVQTEVVPITAPVTTIAGNISQNLKIGMKGDDVKILQSYLIAQKTGEMAQLLATYGPTGTFGRLTQAALIEFQQKNGIAPAVGYCGPLTRAYIAAHL